MKMEKITTTVEKLHDFFWEVALPRITLGLLLLVVPYILWAILMQNALDRDMVARCQAIDYPKIAWYAEYEGTACIRISSRTGRIEYAPIPGADNGRFQFN